MYGASLAQPHTQSILPAGELPGLRACALRIDQTFRRSRAVLSGGAVRACVSSSPQVPPEVGGVSCGAGGAIEWEDRGPVHSGWLLGDSDEAACDRTGHSGRKRISAATKGGLGRRRILRGRRTVGIALFARTAVCSPLGEKGNWRTERSGCVKWKKV